MLPACLTNCVTSCALESVMFLCKHSHEAGKSSTYITACKHRHTRFETRQCAHVCNHASGSHPYQMHPPSNARIGTHAQRTQKQPRNPIILRLLRQCSCPHARAVSHPQHALMRVQSLTRNMPSCACSLSPATCPHARAVSHPQHKFAAA